MATPLPGQELSTLDFKSMIGGPLSAVVGAQLESSTTTVNFVKTLGFEPETKDANGNLIPGKPIYVSFRYPKEVAPYQPATTTISVAVSAAGGGSGYTSAPAVTISGGSGRGATAVAIIAQGAVASINITNQGVGYLAGDNLAVTIADPPAGTSAKAATATAQVTQNAPQPALFQEMELNVPFLAMLPIPFIRIEDTTIAFHAKIHSIEYARTDTSLSGSAGGGAQIGGVLGSFFGSANLNVSTSYQSKTTQGNSVDRTYSMDIHIHAVQEELPAGLERILGILENAMKSQPVGSPQAASLPGGMQNRALPAPAGIAR